MKMNRKTVLRTRTGKQGIFFEGECQVGHKRRCPNILIEPAVSFGEGCEIEAAYIGMGSFVGRRTSVRRAESIGRFTTIGEYCRIGVWEPAASGELSDSWPLRDHALPWSRELLFVEHTVRTGQAARVRIGNDVWIGDLVVIAEGVTIEDGAVIRPGTVVRENVPAYGIFSGNPGRLEAYRFEQEERERLQKIKWWEYGVELVRSPDLSRSGISEILNRMEQEKTEGKEKIPMGREGFFFTQKLETCSVFLMAEGKKRLLCQIPES